MYCCCKKYKSCLLWTLLKSCFYEISMREKQNVFLFPLLISLLSMLLLVLPQELLSCRGEKFPSPQQYYYVYKALANIKYMWGKKIHIS